MDPKRRIAVTAGLWAGGLVAAWVAFAQAPRTTTPPTAGSVVATVAGRPIESADFEQRVRQSLERYTSRGTPLPADARRLLRRQVLEGAIRGELMALEARRTADLVPAAEVEAVMRRDPFFSPGGRFDEARWNAIRNTQKAQFSASFTRVQDQLSAQRLTERLLARLSPPEAELRAEATRQTSRVGIGHLTLRRAEFDGTFPEPREQAVYDRYSSNRSWYARPARVTMSVVFVNTPGLSAEERKDAARARAWSQRMLRSADSLLAALRSGGDLEELAAPHGGVRPKVVATTGDLPGFWKGDAAAQTALFTAERGSYLPRPIEGSEGYLVVRVDDVSSAHVATLAEVAREIRGQLRDDLKRNHVDYELRDLYVAMRDTLVSDAWRVRWAFADPSSARIAEPSMRELDTYYRTRLADYSRFDAEQGRIVAAPLAEVRDEVRERWMQDRRLQDMRARADRLYRSWGSGRREPSLERELATKESPPTPAGAALDDTPLGATLADSLWRRGVGVRVGLVPVAGGFAVYEVFQTVHGHVPTYEQARTRVKAAFDRDWLLREERGARALFDADPSRFRGGDIISFTRVHITPPDLMEVSLTRADVDRWFRANLDKYSAPELVRVRHLLVVPTSSSDAADRAARDRAAALLARIRGGESLAQMAQEHSEDEATRSKGGDLGTFGRGVMLPGFEAAAFAMRPGQISDLVRTEAGYHIIECVEYEPAVVQPLELVYSNVASELAQTRAESLAVWRADSLLRQHRTPTTLARALRGAGYDVVSYSHRIGDRINSSIARPFFESLEQTAPGQIIRPAHRLKGQGAWVGWVDSVSAPISTTWEDARARAIEAFRSSAGERALAAKQAEIDSLLAGGWSADTLAALWGGLAVIGDLVPGAGIPGLGGSAAVDSFVFGDARHPQAAVGATSGWIRQPNGVSRITVLGRETAPPEVVAARLEQVRGEAIEARLREHFRLLEARYPVRILDPELRAIELPAPRPAGGSRARR